ncbi:MAG: VCBS repeat-containing protein, partial [Bacteroidetes bacterium]|nr:VCBS repeat-containing protein [Bacteroidota bacterium]
MRYLAALLLLAFYFTNASAQQFNHQYIKYKRSGLDSRQSAAIVDHNHDGKPDVVSSFESGFDMLCYTNDGKTYTPQVIADSLPGYDFMQSTDINNDGHTDVLVAFKNNNGFWDLGLWLNNGKDAFSKIQVGSIGDPTYKIEVADFDNDGDQDILLDPKGYNNYFWYYENDGNLHFTQSFVNFAGQPAVLFGIDDLNNDGLIDVLAAAFNFKTNQYDLVAVEQDTTHKDRWLPNAFDAVNRVEGGITGQFDGQNRADLFFAPQTVSNTDAYLYTHSGNFSFKKSNAITVPKYLVAQQTIDFNTDGKLDFFYTDLDGIHVMQNRGNGQFNKLK